MIGQVSLFCYVAAHWPEEQRDREPLVLPAAGFDAEILLVVQAHYPLHLGHRGLAPGGPLAAPVVEPEHTLRGIPRPPATKAPRVDAQNPALGSGRAVKKGGLNNGVSQGVLTVDPDRIYQE